MRLAAAALLLASALYAASTDPKIHFIKSFPGSIPAYVSIELYRSGEGIYKEAPDDEDPAQFKLAQSDVDQIFALADKLDKFKRPIESNMKVANMGQKTFRFEHGSIKNEQKFNYSLDLDAQAMLDWFERLTETQRLHWDLERTAKFDRLGVNKTLLQIEAASDRKRIVAGERFLPLLDRVAKNDSYLHMARERAAKLADMFRHPEKKETPPEQSQ